MEGKILQFHSSPRISIAILDFQNIGFYKIRRSFYGFLDSCRFIATRVNFGIADKKNKKQESAKHETATSIFRLSIYTDRTSS